MRRVALGDVVTVVRQPASSADCTNLPYVGLEHLESDSGQFESNFRPDPAELLATKFLFDQRHVLYGKLRPYLNKVVRPNFCGVCSTEILPLASRSEVIDRDYLHRLLLSRRFVEWASINVSGANLPRLDPSTLQEFEFDLPPLPEQRRIAAQLEQADRLRRVRRYALELSDTFLPATFRRMFGTTDSPTSDTNLLPLGNYLSFVTSGARGWAEHYTKSGSRFIRSLDVRMNEISDEDTVFVAAPKGAEADRTRVLEDDVLLTITGSQIGRVAAVPAKLAGAYVSQHVAILRLKPGLLPIFAAMFLSLKDGGQREIERLQYGQTKPGLNFDQIREFRVPIPSLPKQRHFAELVTQHERLRATQRESLRQAEHLFQTLLHRAFSPA